MILLKFLFEYATDFDRQIGILIDEVLNQYTYNVLTLYFLCHFLYFWQFITQGGNLVRFSAVCNIMPIPLIFPTCPIHHIVEEYLTIVDLRVSIHN